MRNKIKSHTLQQVQLTKDNIRKRSFYSCLFFSCITTSILIGSLLKMYNDTNKYLLYIAEHGRNGIEINKYQTLAQAYKISRLFSPPSYSLDNKQEKTNICNDLEFTNGVYNLNLPAKNNNTNGTFQFLHKNCINAEKDISTIFMSGVKDDYFSIGNMDNYLSYYIDFDFDYIFIDRALTPLNYVFNTWLKRVNKNVIYANNTRTEGLSSSDLSMLSNGFPVLSRIYNDRYSRKNIISILAPVFSNGIIKGVFVTDLNAINISNIFKTKDRPLLWRFLDLTLIDQQSGMALILHKSIANAPSGMTYNIPVLTGYGLYIQLDIIYFIINATWIFLIYFVCTLLFIYYIRSKYHREYNLYHDNINDTFTGCYNRKILNTSFEENVLYLLKKDITVHLIAIDCNHLKVVNDTFGHAAGDKLIMSLSESIKSAIDERDCPIRMGGDEFIIFLLDRSNYELSTIINCIDTKFNSLCTDYTPSFSFGIYNMNKNDSLLYAIEQADAALYLAKRKK